MKIFKTKVAVASKEVAEQQIKFKDMGIDTSIDDSDVKYRDVFIPYKNILYSEEDGDGFTLVLINDEEIYCLDNPFEEGKE